jgi:hypothetical protein
MASRMKKNLSQNASYPEYLKHLRTDQEYSLSVLAFSLEMSSRDILRHESGDFSKSDRKYLGRFSSFYGVDYDTLEYMFLKYIDSIKK